MTWTMSEEIAQALSGAAKEPLVALAGRGGESILDRKGVEAILPHRDPFLFVDRVAMLDLEAGIIAAYYDLSRAQDVFAGHFPNHPIWPGVLQVEAIAQAGIILYLKQIGAPRPPNVSLTHIAGARFLRPIAPDGELGILARVFEDGLFFTVVGQCLLEGNVCSVATVSGLTGDF